MVQKGAVVSQKKAASSMAQGSSSSWTATAVASCAMVLGAYQLKKYAENREKVQRRQKTVAALETVSDLKTKIVSRIYDLEEEAAEAEFMLDEENQYYDEEEAYEQEMRSAYYHFDSNGKKLPNKWDTFDVDAELEKLEENDVMPPSSERPSTIIKKEQDAAASKRRRKNRDAMLRKAQGLQHELESILSFLDTNIRGDAEIKSIRKEIVLDINNEYLPRLDDIRFQLLEL